MKFSIRDILWLTVLVAVALTLWLGWSRESAVLRETATRETKLREQALMDREQAVASRDAAWKAVAKIQSDHEKRRLELDKREFALKHQQMLQEKVEAQLRLRQAAARELSSTSDKENH